MKILSLLLTTVKTSDPTLISLCFKYIHISLIPFQFCDKCFFSLFSFALGNDVLQYPRFQEH